MIWVVQRMRIYHQLMTCFDNVNSSHMQQVLVHQAPSRACIDVLHPSALNLVALHISHKVYVYGQMKQRLVSWHLQCLGFSP